MSNLNRSITPAADIAMMIRTKLLVRLNLRFKDFQRQHPISLSREMQMQIDRSDYAAFGEGRCFARYEDIIEGDLFTTLARNRARGISLTWNMSRRDRTRSRREEGTRCLIHRIEPILQHTENGGYLADRVRSRGGGGGGLLAGRGTQPGKCCRAFQELSSAFAVASSAIRGF